MSLRPISGQCMLCLARRAAQRSPQSRRRPVNDGEEMLRGVSRLRALRRRAAPACVACCWARTGLQRLDLDLTVAATVDLVRHKGAVSRCRVQSSPARRRCGCASLSSSLTAHTAHNRQQENHQADSLKWCAIHLSATIRAYWQQLTPCAVAAPPVCQSALWTTAT